MLSLQLQGLEIIEVAGVTKTRIEHITGGLPAITKYRLHVYGEAAVIKIKKENAPKSDEYGVTVIFACYSANRPGDCYCFFNPKTLKTYHSRDATWPGRLYWPPRKDRGSGNVLPQEDNVVASDAGSEYIDESDDDNYIPAITGIVKSDLESEDEES